MNKEYIERLQLVISQLHGADSKHIESVPVLETFRGQTVREGIVEVFELLNHSNAKRCYAWSKGEDLEEKFTAVLELPPAISPKTAVQASIVASVKKGRK